MTSLPYKVSDVAG